MEAGVTLSRSCTTGPLLGRYLVEKDSILGSGGWCVVRRAIDTKANGHAVAVKFFNAQAHKECSEEALQGRFAREVRTFRALRLGPESGSSADELGHRRIPRDLFVNLLDFSSVDGKGSEPGPYIDGHCYTVLELADGAMDVWLQQRLEAGRFVSLDELRDIAMSLASGLSWLHRHGYCHLDIKPANVMRFGSRWKLIDLEGCLTISNESRVFLESFTPLYASPELARFALSVPTQGKIGPAPAGAMDVWAAGVVLMDVLAHGATFQERKSGFDAGELFDEPAVPHEAWWTWLVDPEPLDVAAELSSAPSVSLDLLHREAPLKALLKDLLEKDPALRLPAYEFQQHAFLACGQIATEPAKVLHVDASVATTTTAGNASAVSQPCSKPSASERVTAVEALARPVEQRPISSRPALATTASDGIGNERSSRLEQAPAPGAGVRTQVEQVFRQAEQEGHVRDGCLPAAQLLMVCRCIGLGAEDAESILAACHPSKTDKVPYRDFLDFLYGPASVGEVA